MGMVAATRAPKELHRMELDPSTFDSMTTEEFARTVKQMSDKEISETMRGEHRGPGPSPS